MGAAAQRRPHGGRGVPARQAAAPRKLSSLIAAFVRLDLSCFGPEPVNLSTLGAWLPRHLLGALILAAALLAGGEAAAHAVSEGDRGYIQEITGVNIIPFVYLGAKHMVTGYDHILFLLGVIFFLYRLKHIGIYVSLFALGHSVTMLLGVSFNVGINSYIIDAIIGLSVVYKALDNMGTFRRWLGFQPNTKAATLLFGFCHGFGLSTKIIEYNISPDGLLPNLLAFNVGVEIGQLLALGAILIAMTYWRRTSSFQRHAYFANVVMMTLGFMLFGYQVTGYFVV
ncbi:HupE/UreJ family protein [Roseomonas sp. USHLN139]|uniref:HupE/UreJ family protein n=1 Tax=Roseomonas sp. USHLN139 TaxID=3081298 RepID=UPI003B01AE56